MKSEEEIFDVITKRLDNTNASLDKANSEIKQLNNKVATQNYNIKQFQTDLKIESEKREELENQLSKKDTLLTFISLISGIVGGCIVVLFEHCLLPIISQYI